MHYSYQFTISIKFVIKALRSHILLVFMVIFDCSRIHRRHWSLTETETSLWGDVLSKLLTFLFLVDIVPCNHIPHSSPQLATSSTWQHVKKAFHLPMPAVIDVKDMTLTSYFRYNHTGSIGVNWHCTRWFTSLLTSMEQYYVLLNITFF